MYYAHSDDLFLRVEQLLRNAVGAEKAITIGAICAALGVSRRVIEQCIEENIARFAFPLVADGAGYHIPTEPREINEYAEALRGRCMRIFMRRREVLRKAAAAGFRREGKQFVAAPAQLEFPL